MRKFKQQENEIKELKKRVETLEKEKEKLIMLPNLHQVLHKNNHSLYFSRLTGDNIDCSNLISWTNLSSLEIIVTRTNGNINFFRGLWMNNINIMDISVVKTFAEKLCIKINFIIKIEFISMYFV